MDLLTIILIIAGLCLFETISSVDNAIINAEVLSKMGKRAKGWFMGWGLLSSVFLVRGLLPWAIIWTTVPDLGPLGALTATFSNDPQIHVAIAKASPILLIGGGVFLLFLFFNWLFLEEKHYGLKSERFFQRQGVWFFAVVSVLLAIIVWLALEVEPLMAFGAVLGSTAFFIVHGFQANAKKQEQELMSANSNLSDTSKILFLMIIDATFSLDGVLGAFAFTLAVPLILVGNGLGSLVVRQLTLSNLDKAQKYIYLKNGAMYSIMVLGLIMLLESFGNEIPAWLSPLATFGIVGYFFLKSKKALS
ncbi:MAG TPA: DUF475 domain-containing protein [Patescibacteria group bacterium]